MASGACTKRRRKRSPNKSFHSWPLKGLHAGNDMCGLPEVITKHKHISVPSWGLAANVSQELYKKVQGHNNLSVTALLNTSAPKLLTDNNLNAASCVRDEESHWAQKLKKTIVEHLLMLQQPKMHQRAQYQQ